MSDLIFFPASEETLISRDKPKGPYVHLVKTFREFNASAKGEESEYVEKEEDYFMDVSAAPNYEAVENLRTHQKVRVLGFGNFPKNPTFGRFAAELKSKSELMFEDVNNPTRKALEAKIVAELEAKKAAEEASPVAPAGKGKAKKAAEEASPVEEATPVTE